MMDQILKNLLKYTRTIRTYPQLKVLGGEGEFFPLICYQVIGYDKMVKMTGSNKKILFWTIQLTYSA